jgi:hypothetical protein
VVEGEVKGQLDLSQFYAKPDHPPRPACDDEA